MSRRVIVLGATGFVGHHSIVPLLAQGYEIHAVASRANAGQADGVTWHRVDLHDGAATDALFRSVRASHLLNFAWFVEHRQFWTSAENYRWVATTSKIVDAFIANGGTRCVTAGTCAEYDWTAGHCVERVTPLDPATPYGQCKAATNVLIESMAVLHAISAAWGRIFLLHGPREDRRRLVASVVRGLLRGETVACSHGEQVRDFLSARDVAEAFVALLSSDVRGPVNIASGEPVTIKTMVGRIADLIGPPGTVAFGAIPPAANDPAVLTADVTRLRNEVGWRPARSTDSGLRETIDWWRVTAAHEPRTAAT